MNKKNTARIVQKAVGMPEEAACEFYLQTNEMQDQKKMLVPRLLPEEMWKHIFDY